MIFNLLWFFKDSVKINIKEKRKNVQRNQLGRLYIPYREFEQFRRTVLLSRKETWIRAKVLGGSEEFFQINS
jgi:hypothetical protein